MAKGSLVQNESWRVIWQGKINSNHRHRKAGCRRGHRVILCDLLPTKFFCGWLRRSSCCWSWCCCHLHFRLCKLEFITSRPVNGPFRQFGSGNSLSRPTPRRLFTSLSSFSLFLFAICTLWLALGRRQCWTVQETISAKTVRFELGPSWSFDSSLRLGREILQSIPDGVPTIVAIVIQGSTDFPEIWTGHTYDASRQRELNSVGL